MRNRRWSVLWVLTVGVLLAACGQTPQVAEVDVEAASERSMATFGSAEAVVDAWFVQFAAPPATRGGAASERAAERTSFRSEAAAERIAFEERFDFGTLYNGLSIRASAADAARLERLPSVAAVFPVVLIDAPELSPETMPDLFTALGQTGADIAQDELGYDGTGIRVGIIDTGVDYDHPDLGGCFGPGCRVEVGFDFVGDAYNANPDSPSYDPVPRPGPDPDDCNGHGTHVAGIVGASGSDLGSVTGVAPGATLGAYRVFGCEGSSAADVIVAAFERALADGMDVVNLSLGAAFQWPQYPTAVAADNLVEAGVVVVASIGNSGATGLYSAGAPGVGANVIGVASFDNVAAVLPAFTVSPDGAAFGYVAGAGVSEPPTVGSFPMARTGTSSTTNDACNAVAPIAGSLTGHVALVRRGTCSFYEKAINAQNAGAVGVVLYNNAPGYLTPTVTGSPPVTIPVVMIAATDGAALDAQIANGPVELTWTDQVTSSVLPSGNLISSFSSFGLAPDLTLKPDLGAPGGSIYATYPLELGGYASLSGTSMAAPHVAGAVALLLEARPDLLAGDVRGILQNHADPKNWSGSPGLGFLDHVHRQGAGMLDIDDAILATTRIAPAKLSLGESEAGPFRATLRIANDGTEAVTYDLAHVPALSTGPNTYVVSASTGFASVSFSSSTVTVPAGGSATVDVTIDANPGLADLSQYGGYLVFTPQGGGAPLRVPYAGLKGDYQSKQVLTLGGPVLAWTPNGANFGLAGEGDVFTMQGFDVPYVFAHFDHPSRYFEMRIHTVVRGRTQLVHPVFHATNVFEYLPRNSTATGSFAFAWDGTRYHSANANGNGRMAQQFKTVPDGDYLLEVRVLKALGDPSNPAHWETWTSPRFTIARP